MLASASTPNPRVTIFMFMTCNKTPLSSISIPHGTGGIGFREKPAIYAKR
jgi:hypothetical protein